MIFKRTLWIFVALTSTCLCADKATPAPATPSQENTAEPAAPQTSPYFSDPLSPAPLPSSEEMTTSYESAFLRMIATLIGLVVLIFGTFWILRRLGRGKMTSSSGRSIQILEKRALSPKSVLYLIEVDHKKILVAESQVEVRTLTQIDEEPPIEE